MGWIRTTGIAAIAVAAAMLAAPAVRAQAIPPAPEADPAEVQQLIDQLQGLLVQLSEGTGMEVPDLGPVFTPLFEAALLPVLEDADASFGLAFKINSSVTNGEELQADADQTPAYADAQACAADQPGRSVVYFERLVVRGGVGHHCVTTGPGTLQPEAWLLSASYVVEAANRRLESRFGAAVSAGTDDASAYAASLAIGDPRAAALIAVSDQIGVTATRLLLDSAVPDAAR